MVASVEEAFALREGGVGQICMGEVGGRPIEGFDFGNSPYELSKVDLNGVAVVQRTSAGTQGITIAAKAAQHMFAASLVTVSATARALRLVATDRITLVAMGENGKAAQLIMRLSASTLFKQPEEEPSSGVKLVGRLVRYPQELARFAAILGGDAALGVYSAQVCYGRANSRVALPLHIPQRS